MTYFDRIQMTLKKIARPGQVMPHVTMTEKLICSYLDEQAEKITAIQKQLAALNTREHAE